MRVGYGTVILLLLSLSHCFQLGSKFDYAAQGFKQFVSKFGDKFWHKNDTMLEETIV